MAEEIENVETGGESTPPSKGKAPLDMKVILIGAATFVVFLIIFLFMGGAFSPAPQAPIVEQPQETQHQDSVTENNEEHDDYISGSWNKEYSEFSADDEGGAEPDSGMSPEDSVKQVLWYQAQRQEIERERTRLRTEASQLQQLKMETQALLERRQQIEQTNISNLAKLFETMKAEEVASIMESIPNIKVGLILQKMKKQNASKVMASLPSERAAKITMELIDLGGEY